MFAAARGIMQEKRAHRARRRWSMFPLAKPANGGKLFFYFALLAGMAAMNFTMRAFEPFSLALYAAALACGLPALPMTALFWLAGLPCLAAVPLAFAVYAAQGALLGAVFFVYGRKKKEAGAELALWLLAALLPFALLYGKFLYADYLRAALTAAALYALCFVFYGALRFVLRRAGRCLPAPEELLFCGAAAAAAGIGLYNGAGPYAYEGAALLALLLSCAALQSGNAVFCAFVLAIPPAVCESVAAAAPVLTAPAAYILFAALALAFLRAGKLPAALAVFLAEAAVLYFTQFYAADSPAAALAGPRFYLTLLVPLLPCLVFALIPERATNALARRLRRFGERPLTRAGIDRDRLRTGERLFEVSAAFREIGCAFAAPEEADGQDALQQFMLEQLEGEHCAACERRESCRAEGAGGELAKLVAVGAAKGKVSLIDLPSRLAGSCADPAGLLFSLNKLLAEYRRRAADAESAARGRALMAELAAGVAGALKELALELSAPAGGHEEQEQQLRAALGRAGVACGEVLIGDGRNVLIATEGRADGETLRAAVEEVCGFRAAPAARRALTAGRQCWTFRPLPRFDAAFGVAGRTKDGETACGDTHSLTRIDERTCLCALADGMGSGAGAREVSDRALTLLESFYRAGMRGPYALDAVNGLLAATRDESFACVDAAAVDLDTGRADIVKIGSPVGFLLSAEKAELLEGGSLPLGILDAVRPAVFSRELRDGDVLLFLSDGIADAFGSSADLAEFLSRESLSNPQTLADRLLAAALERAGGARDDMTALAVRLFENAA